MQKHNDGDLMAPEGTGRQAEIGQDQKREKNCLERGLCVQGRKSLAMWCKEQNARGLVAG